MMKMEYALEQEADDSSHGTRRKKMKNKRRFSDEQIKSLESIFEEENKLEPQKKVQLARDLGLHPRQVAIWFQNKRARWKSKQLEKEYSTLRADYDALTSSFELLKEEKQCLLKQVLQLQKLGDLIEKHPKQNRCCETGNVVVGDIDNKDAKCSEYEEKLVLDSGSDLTLIVYSEGGNGKNIEGFEHKEPELQSMGESADGSLTLPHWSDFDSGCFSDQSCSSLQWWDLWH